jgi:NAD+ kinase
MNAARPATIPPRRVGVLYLPRRSEAVRLAEEVQRDLRARGLEVWAGPTHDEAALRQVAPTLDLLITLGGDGTIVHAVDTVVNEGVPILGVKLGRLGFLAEVEPEGLAPALAALCAGQYTVEERLMLHAELWRDGQVLYQAEAINDVVMARGSASRTVRVAVEVDGHHMMTQTADGVIVSTPTGSTAYCLAAGGPIVAPDVPSMIITPIAAHLAVARAIVIAAARRLCLRLLKGPGAMLTVDGQSEVALEQEDEVYCTASAQSARLVRFGNDGHFYETVLRRLRWPDQSLLP